MARWLSLSGFVTLLVLCPSACKNQAPPAAEAPSSVPSPAGSNAPEAQAAVPSAAVAPAVAAASKYSEAAFDLAIEAKGNYTSGQAGEAEIVLAAKPPFHVNDNYPYKFKLKEAAGLKFANLLVSKDSVKLEHARATIPVAFTPEAGTHTLSGQLSFSVCTADKCMIEKRDLALEIAAK